MVNSECTGYKLQWPMNKCDSSKNHFQHLSDAPIHHRLFTSQPCAILNTSHCASSRNFTNALDNWGFSLLLGAKVMVVEACVFRVSSTAASTRLRNISPEQTTQEVLGRKLQRVELHALHSTPRRRNARLCSPSEGVLVMAGSFC